MRHAGPHGGAAGLCAAVSGRARGRGILLEPEPGRGPDECALPDGPGRGRLRVVYHGHDPAARHARGHGGRAVRACSSGCPRPAASSRRPARPGAFMRRGARAGASHLGLCGHGLLSGDWIVALAHRIIAPRVGLIGSIGVVIVHEDWSAALKNMASPSRPSSSGEEDRWRLVVQTERARPRRSAGRLDQCGRTSWPTSWPAVPADRGSHLGTEAGLFHGRHDDDAGPAWPCSWSTSWPARKTPSPPCATRSPRTPIPSPPSGNPARRAEGARLGFPCENREEASMANETQGGR